MPDTYTLETTSLFDKDYKQFRKLKNKQLESKLAGILEGLQQHPTYHASAKQGDLQGFYTRNLDSDYRLMFQVNEAEKSVTLHQLNTHDTALA